MSASHALSHIRIADFTGQLAGAGATRMLAAFGAQIIRIEDPTNQGRWDIMRGVGPFVDSRRGNNLAGVFNNHNVEKLGITLNLKTERGKQLFERLVSKSDAVTENFAAGVLARLGYPYERLREIRPDLVYVSNCGFGHSGPYVQYKTWGPAVQALAGLTFDSGMPGIEPAGWGYSYMDCVGSYYMAIAILMALYHRSVTGEGQWVDYSTVEAAITLSGPAILDYTVNGRPSRREGMPDSNHSRWPRMAPHYIYPADAEDTWVAIACRDDADWERLTAVIAEEWARSVRFAKLADRLRAESDLDDLVAAWTRRRGKHETVRLLREAGVPAAAVQSPQERIDVDPRTGDWGLWPEVRHTQMGNVRVDGVPVHLSQTDWEMCHGGPCLGEHNDYVYGAILGLKPAEIAELKAEGTI